MDKSELLKKINIGKEECKGIATSGDYERYKKINGKKFSHIIDPKTGQPVKEAHSVTITGKNATLADALATSISIKHKNVQFIKKIVEKFNIKVYTLTGKNLKWREF